MKRLLKISTAILLVIAATQTTSAQFKFSGGLELGFALEDNFGLMYGASIGGEMLLGEKSGITAQTGYIKVVVDAPDFFDKYSFSFLPIQLGYKYYFNSNESGAYVHGQMGVHISMSSIEFTSFDIEIDPVTFQFTTVEKKVSENNSGSNLSYAFGGGYLINEHIDLGLRYNILAGDGGGFNYIGLRAAYQF